jgi:hypothetical protein
LTPPGAAAAPGRIRIELPDGWLCLDLESAQPDQLRAAVVASGGPSTPDAEQSVLGVARWLREQGASTALLRPGDDVLSAAICGGLFVLDALPIEGDALYAALDAEGEPVALGSIEGIPIISHVYPEPPNDELPTPTLRVTYFICAPSMCIVIIFVAVDCGDRKTVVDEVAKIVSAARVVHSDAGCPV